jgi:hypothetical protein
MFKHAFIAAVASMPILVGASAFAQDREIQMREINVYAERRDAADRGNADRRDAADRGNQRNGRDAPDRAVASRPALPEDRGYPPPSSMYPGPFSGIEPGLNVYADGSYDLLQIDRRSGTYTIDRYDSWGNRVGGEHGSLEGYVRSGPPAEVQHYPIIAPPPVYGWVCYTPNGALRVINAMVVGQPCFVTNPWGTFYGTAGV